MASILGLFSKQFVFQFVLALFVALPISYYGLSIWLDSFVHKINLTSGIFIIPAFAVIVLALVTIVYQGISASLVNPTENLRND
jgi:putative ABC transport system permease protein